MKLYSFEVATKEDVESMIRIEETFFEKGVAYNKEFILKWMEYNPYMFYKVEDRNGSLKAFTILVPITADCYHSLVRGEMNDMISFREEDVLKETKSEYYYFADIAAASKDALASYSILNGIQIYLCQNAHYVATTPLTEDGIRICELFGFGPVLEKGKNCFLEITKEMVEEKKNGFRRTKTR